MRDCLFFSIHRISLGQGMSRKCLENRALIPDLLGLSTQNPQAIVKTVKIKQEQKSNTKIVHPVQPNMAKSGRFRGKPVTSKKPSRECTTN